MFDLKQYCADLKTIVNIDSHSCDPVGVNRVADFFQERFRQLGWHVVRHTLDGKTGDYLEISNRPAEHYDVLMIGHMDTVFPAGTAKERPFCVTGNIAGGPGASDMKGGILAMLYIAKELSPHVLERLNICILMNPDEEISSMYSRKLTMDIACRTDYAFVMEGTALHGVYTTRRCGNMLYEIKFHGIAQHSGYILTKPNASAIVEMAHWILAINALTSHDTQTTANVGVVSGGLASNIVPENAEMTVDFRFPNEIAAERIRQALARLHASSFVPGVTSEYICISDTPPMVPGQNTELYIATMARVFDRIGQPFSLIDLRGGCSDGNFIASVGTICVDSLGPRAGGGHTDQEYVYLDQVEECIVRMTALIEEISEHKHG
jgi:glutamate carboxypeptidase